MSLSHPNHFRKYSLFGMAVHSEFDLGGGTEALANPADVIIRRGQVGPVRKATLDDEFVKYSDLGAFHIHRGREVVAAVAANAPPELLTVFLNGRAMAFVLRQRGWLPLHASAVQIEGQAVLFLAPVGTGKSTTAAAFQAAGYTVLSDDVCPVRVRSGVCVLRPGKARLRLCADAASAFWYLDPASEVMFDKADFNIVRPPVDPEIPVARVYLLENGDDFRLESVTPITATTSLGRECFIRLQNAAPDVLSSHLRDCTAVAGRALVYRLTRPRGLGLLGKLVDLVVRDVARFLSDEEFSARRRDE